MHGFSYEDIDAKTTETINFLQSDTVGMLYAGFESEPARINARLAQTMPGPCTLMGYGIKTTYEMAAFTNGAMIRHTDFNTSPHNNEMFGGILAVGEALHSSGPDVLAAMAISYEVIQAIGNTGKGNYDPDGWDCPYHSVGVCHGLRQTGGSEPGSAGQRAFTGDGSTHAHVRVPHRHSVDVEGHPQL